jgi:fermentation-respiration switch protein FrsA (DUF1100 family)
MPAELTIGELYDRGGWYILAVITIGGYTIGAWAARFLGWLLACIAGAWGRLQAPCGCHTCRAHRPLTGHQP